MERQLHDNDFERFLKQNADQYRMFPSENVWKGIHNTLHTRRRWTGFWLALLLLTTGSLTWLMLTNTPDKKDKLTYLEKGKPALNTNQPEPAADPVIAPKVNKTKHTPIASPGNGEENLFLSSVSSDETENYTVPQGLSLPVTAALSPVRTSLENLRLYDIPAVTARPVRTPQLPVSRIIQTTEPTVITPEAVTLSAPVLISNADMAVIPETATADKKETSQQPVITELLPLPLTIESVINSYQHTKVKRKVQWQFYITPTYTYRKLDENKQFINSARTNLNSNASPSSGDLNNIVTHRPDIGFQLGVSLSRALNQRLSVVTGFQFNVSKYDIWAYNYYPGELATVALSNDYGGTNTVSRVTNYRIIGVNRANKANWLRNFYYSVSMPVGVDYKIAKAGKTQIGVTATAQPTYIVGNRAYVISTDYKNYMEVPSLTRKWNMNAGIETYAGFKLGKTDWRIGPQVRYQTMSSFKNEYPVQEHLFDYGLKLGIMLNH